MGVVWHARDEFLHRDVALKEISRLTGPDAESTFGRTLREARAAAALKHPDIITVHDIVEHDGRLWIVMELISGRSLADLVNEDGPLPEHRAAEIGQRVLGALDVAHRNGILHRDVKPANILLGGDRVVLSDFGIAAMADATVLTGPNQLIGSPEYLAPERITGDEATPKADLWALGVTLYFAVSGRSPFQRAGTRECLAAVLTQDPDPLPPTHVGRLWPVIHGLLHKDPTERLTAPRIDELLSALVTSPTPPTERQPVPPATVILAPAPTKPQPPVPSSRRSRPLAGYRLPALAIAALVVATLVWLAVRQSESGTTGAPPTQTSSPETTRSTTTSSPPPSVPPGYKLYQDIRGYSVAVPHSWDRPSVHGASDYRVAGTLLFLEINRGADQPGATAHPFLVEYEKSDPWIAQKVTDYQRIRLDTLPAPATGSTAAELEYTYRYLNPDHTWTYHHELVRVVITEPGHVYVVECHILETDPNLLAQQWQAVTPTVNTILGSFRVVP